MYNGDEVCPANVIKTNLIKQLFPGHERLLGLTRKIIFNSTQLAKLIKEYSSHATAIKFLIQMQLV